MENNPNLPVTTEQGEDGYNRSAMSISAESPAMMTAVARERFTLEAMLAQARMYPRDERECFSRMVNAAKRPSFAARAEYSFPRGSAKVIGVSVTATRPLANYWKYLRFGWTILRWDNEGYAGVGFCHDLQEGSHKEHPFEGRWVHQRKNRDTGKTEWMTITDEREKREKIGKDGSIAERNAVLAIIPPDIIEDFIEACRKTNRDVAKGDLKQDRAKTLRSMAAAFGEYGVTTLMIDTKLGHPLEQVNEDELADLRSIYTAISREGERVDSFFPATSARPVTQSTTIDLAKAREGVAVDPPGGKAFGDVGAKPATTKSATKTAETSNAFDKAADDRSKQ